jgi:hypothetical protein
MDSLAALRRIRPELLRRTSLETPSLPTMSFDQGRCPAARALLGAAFGVRIHIDSSKQVR